MNREEEIQKEIKELKENINFADMDMAETNDSEYYDLVGLEAELKGILETNQLWQDRVKKLKEELKKEFPFTSEIIGSNNNTVFDFISKHLEGK